MATQARQNSVSATTFAVPADASGWHRATRLARAASLAPAARALAALQAETGAAPPAAAVTPDPWPKSATVNGAEFTIYQPQLDKWDDYSYEAHAAVRVIPAGSKDPVFGVIEITAYTIVDRASRVVYIEGLTIAKATFPSAPQNAAAWQAEIQQIASKGPGTMSLGRLEAALAIEGAERKALRVPVENTPPQIVFTQSSAVLVLLQGEPVWAPVSGTSFKRAINTRALLLRDAYGMLYVHVLDGFMTSASLTGPWTVSTSPPAGATKTAEQLAKKGLVDLMEGQRNQTGKTPTLVADPPLVVVATQPTEVITTNGPMDWQPIEGTQLLYVSNTTGNIFIDLTNQQYYVLVTGRWFTATTQAGPWFYVAGKDLPLDFALIPDTSPKENVKASVPGTPQAEEAAIEAEIPQTATVYVAKVSFKPVLNGAPQLRPIPSTPLMYVFNSPQPIVMVTPTQWYAVQAGVWFTAPSIQGPWTVATAIPAVIYSIPPSSPVYYVTFVRVYAVSPGVVVVGYTAGYTGVVVTPDGTVVYGTGYVYPAYVTTTVWYPPPVTYGYAANVTYTPWTGFAMGFAIGWSAAHWCYAPAPYWGPMPYYYHPPVPYGGAYYGAAYHGAYGGAAAWGPGGWAATSGNMYNHYGTTSTVSRTSAGYNAWTGNAWSSKVGTSYNSATGRMSAGQTASVSNAYTGGYAYGNRGATYNPSTGVSASGGRATVGNAYTGQQTTVGHAQVTGPGGQTTQFAQSGDNYYADHNGNVYNYNSSTGQTQKYNGSTNSWESTQKPASASSASSGYDKSSGSYNYSKPSGSSGESISQSRSAGDSRSASSSWGGGWGGGFDHSGGGGGGGWGGDGGGGGHSWGGGGWGGGGGGGGWGGFHGGGRR
ncbi:MAG TPA: hypothetical protein VMT17_11760 [Anaeromyxobacteraceae bacterium]|nr:hypothetical protein [Anaeromyxobacteraceae bacterium]